MIFGSWEFCPFLSGRNYGSRLYILRKDKYIFLCAISRLLFMIMLLIVLRKMIHAHFLLLLVVDYVDLNSIGQTSANGSMGFFWNPFNMNLSI